MHGGTVSVESDGPGRGATLRVTLPVREHRRGATAEPLDRPRVTSLSGATVLIVDDDPDTLELLSSTVRLAGAIPLPASSVLEALRAVEGTTIDAMVSDIAMPGQDGYTLIILMQDRLGARMPAATVALTAYASAADRTRALDAGFREHLTKPVNPNVLLQTLDDLLAAEAARPRA